MIPEYNKRYTHIETKLTFAKGLRIGGKYIEIFCLENDRLRWLGTEEEFNKDFVELRS